MYGVIWKSFLHSLSQVLEEGHWFFTWDLKSGYHHVDICLEHQRYLGFSWQLNGMLRYYTFTVLPFDLSGACFCFTKLLRPLVSRWRSMGHNSFIYLDDGLGSQQDKCFAATAAIIQKKELQEAKRLSVLLQQLPLSKRKTLTPQVSL